MFSELIYDNMRKVADVAGLDMYSFSLDLFEKYGIPMWHVGDNSSHSFYLGINRQGHIMKASIGYDTEPPEYQAPFRVDNRPLGLGYLGNRNFNR
jgi:hypothetical protein